MGEHIADMHWEPVFLLVPEFPLLTSLQKFGALLELLMLLCSSLGSAGPLGSSCFCAGLKQKPNVSSTKERHQGPAEGVDATMEKREELH